MRRSAGCCSSRTQRPGNVRLLLPAARGTRTYAASRQEQAGAGRKGQAGRRIPQTRPGFCACQPGSGCHCVPCYSALVPAGHLSSCLLFGRWNAAATLLQEEPTAAIVPSPVLFPSQAAETEMNGKEQTTTAPRACPSRKRKEERASSTPKHETTHSKNNAPRRVSVCFQRDKNHVPSARVHEGRRRALARRRPQKDQKDRDACRRSIFAVVLSFAFCCQTRDGRRMSMARPASRKGRLPCLSLLSTPVPLELQRPPSDARIAGGGRRGLDKHTRKGEQDAGCVEVAGPRGAKQSGACRRRACSGAFAARLPRLCPSPAASFLLLVLWVFQKARPNRTLAPLAVPLASLHSSRPSFGLCTFPFPR